MAFSSRDLLTPDGRSKLVRHRNQRHSVGPSFGYGGKEPFHLRLRRVLGYNNHTGKQADSSLMDLDAIDEDEESQNDRNGLAYRKSKKKSSRQRRNTHTGLANSQFRPQLPSVGGEPYGNNNVWQGTLQTGDQALNRRAVSEMNLYRHDNNIHNYEYLWDASTPSPARRTCSATDLFKLNKSRKSVEFDIPPSDSNGKRGRTRSVIVLSNNMSSHSDDALNLLQPGILANGSGPSPAGFSMRRSERRGKSMSEMDLRKPDSIQIENGLRKQILFDGDTYRNNLQHFKSAPDLRGNDANQSKSSVGRWSDSTDDVFEDLEMRKRLPTYLRIRRVLSQSEGALNNLDYDDCESLKKDNSSFDKMKHISPQASSSQLSNIFQETNQSFETLRKSEPDLRMNKTDWARTFVMTGKSPTATTNAPTNQKRTRRAVSELNLSYSQEDTKRFLEEHGVYFSPSEKLKNRHSNLRSSSYHSTSDVGRKMEPDNYACSLDFGSEVKTQSVKLEEKKETPVLQNKIDNFNKFEPTRDNKSVALESLRERNQVVGVKGSVREKDYNAEESVDRKLLLNSSYDEFEEYEKQRDFFHSKYGSQTFSHEIDDTVIDYSSWKTNLANGSKLTSGKMRIGKLQDCDVPESVNSSKLGHVVAPPIDKYANQGFNGSEVNSCNDSFMNTFCDHTDNSVDEYGGALSKRVKSVFDDPQEKPVNLNYSASDDNTQKSNVSFENEMFLFSKSSSGPCRFQENGNFDEVDDGQLDKNHTMTTNYPSTKMFGDPMKHSDDYQKSALELSAINSQLLEWKVDGDACSFNVTNVKPLCSSGECEQDVVVALQTGFLPSDLMIRSAPDGASCVNAKLTPAEEQKTVTPGVEDKSTNTKRRKPRTDKRTPLNLFKGIRHQNLLSGTDSASGSDIDSGRHCEEHQEKQLLSTLNEKTLAPEITSEPETVCEQQLVCEQNTVPESVCELETVNESDSATDCEVFCEPQILDAPKTVCEAKNTRDQVVNEDDAVDESNISTDTTISEESTKVETDATMYEPYQQRHYQDRYAPPIAAHDRRDGHHHHSHHNHHKMVPHDGRGAVHSAGHAPHYNKHHHPSHHGNHRDHHHHPAQDYSNPITRDFQNKLAELQSHDHRYPMGDGFDEYGTVDIHQGPVDPYIDHDRQSRPEHRHPHGVYRHSPERHRLHEDSPDLTSSYENIYDHADLSARKSCMHEVDYENQPPLHNGGFDAGRYFTYVQSEDDVIGDHGNNGNSSSPTEEDLMNNYAKERELFESKQNYAKERELFGKKAPKLSPVQAQSSVNSAHLNDNQRHLREISPPYSDAESELAQYYNNYENQDPYVPPNYENQDFASHAQPNRESDYVNDNIGEIIEPSHQRNYENAPVDKRMFESDEADSPKKSSYRVDYEELWASQSSRLPTTYSDSQFPRQPYGDPSVVKDARPRGVTGNQAQPQYAPSFQPHIREEAVHVSREPVVQQQTGPQRSVQEQSKPTSQNKVIVPRTIRPDNQPQPLYSKPLSSKDRVPYRPEMLQQVAQPMAESDRYTIPPQTMNEADRCINPPRPMTEAERYTNPPQPMAEADRYTNPPQPMTEADRYIDPPQPMTEGNRYVNPPRPMTEADRYIHPSQPMANADRYTKPYPDNDLIMQQSAVSQHNPSDQWSHSLPSQYRHQPRSDLTTDPSDGQWTGSLPRHKDQVKVVGNSIPSHAKSDPSLVAYHGNQGFVVKFTSPQTQSFQSAPPGNQDQNKPLLSRRRIWQQRLLGNLSTGNSDIKEMEPPAPQQLDQDSEIDETIPKQQENVFEKPYVAEQNHQEPGFSRAVVGSSGDSETEAPENQSVAKKKQLWEPKPIDDTKNLDSYSPKPSKRKDNDVQSTKTPHQKQTDAGDEIPRKSDGVSLSKEKETSSIVADKKSGWEDSSNHQDDTINEKYTPPVTEKCDVVKSAENLFNERKPEYLGKRLTKPTPTSVSDRKNVWENIAKHQSDAVEAKPVASVRDPSKVVKSAENISNETKRDGKDEANTLEREGRSIEKEPLSTKSDRKAVWDDIAKHQTAPTKAKPKPSIREECDVVKSTETPSLEAKPDEPSKPKCFSRSLERETPPSVSDRKSIWEDTAKDEPTTAVAKHDGPSKPKRFSRSLERDTPSSVSDRKNVWEDIAKNKPATTDSKPKFSSREKREGSEPRKSIANRRELFEQAGPSKSLDDSASSPVRVPDNREKSKSKSPAREIPLKRVDDVMKMWKEKDDVEHQVPSPVIDPVVSTKKPIEHSLPTSSYVQEKLPSESKIEVYSLPNKFLTPDMPVHTSNTDQLPNPNEALVYSLPNEFMKPEKTVPANSTLNESNADNTPDDERYIRFKDKTDAWKELDDPVSSSSDEAEFQDTKEEQPWWCKTISDADIMKPSKSAFTPKKKDDKDKIVKGTVESLTSKFKPNESETMTPVKRTDVLSEFRNPNPRNTKDMFKLKGKDNKDFLAPSTGSTTPRSKSPIDLKQSGMAALLGIDVPEPEAAEECIQPEIKCKEEAPVSIDGETFETIPKSEWIPWQPNEKENEKDDQLPVLSNIKDGTCKSSSDGSEAEEEIITPRQKAPVEKEMRFSSLLNLSIQSKDHTNPVIDISRIKQNLLEQSDSTPTHNAKVKEANIDLSAIKKNLFTQQDSETLKTIDDFPVTEHAKKVHKIKGDIFSKNEKNIEAFLPGRYASLDRRSSDASSTSDRNPAYIHKTTPKKRRANITDDLTELEDLFDSLDLDNERIMEGAARRDYPPLSYSYSTLPSSTDGGEGDDSRMSTDELSPLSPGDVFNHSPVSFGSLDRQSYREGSFDSLSSEIRRARGPIRPQSFPDKVKDDMAVRSRPRSTSGDQHPRKNIISPRSFLSKSPALAPSISTDSLGRRTPSKTRESDAFWDDMHFRKILRSQSSPSVEAVTSASPSTPSPTSAEYLKDRHVSRHRRLMRLRPEKQSDSLIDDMAYRRLRKDVPPIKAEIPESIYRNLSERNRRGNSNLDVADRLRRARSEPAEDRKQRREVQPSIERVEKQVSQEVEGKNWNKSSPQSGGTSQTVARRPPKPTPRKNPAKGMGIMIELYNSTDKSKSLPDLQDDSLFSLHLNVYGEVVAKQQEAPDSSTAPGDRPVSPQKSKTPRAVKQSHELRTKMRQVRNSDYPSCEDYENGYNKEIPSARVAPMQFDRLTQYDDQLFPDSSDEADYHKSKPVADRQYGYPATRDAYYDKMKPVQDEQNGYRDNVHQQPQYNGDSHNYVNQQPLSEEHDYANIWKDEPDDRYTSNGNDGHYNRHQPDSQDYGPMHATPARTYYVDNFDLNANRKLENHHSQGYGY